MISSGSRVSSGRCSRRSSCTRAAPPPPSGWSALPTLGRHAGPPLPHQQLFDAVWAKSFGNPQQYLRVHMTNLRRKIEREPASPKLIVTDPGVGYRFEGPET